MKKDLKNKAKSAKKGMNRGLAIALLVIMGFLPKVFLTGCPSPSGGNGPTPKCAEGKANCETTDPHIHGELFKFLWEYGIDREDMETFVARYEEWLKNPYRDPSREALDEDGITKKKILVPSTRGHEQDGNLLKLRGNATMLDPLWDTRFALVLWFEDRGSR